MKRLGFILALFISFSWACTTDNANLSPKSLLEYNVPLTILAPDSVKVKKEDWIVRQGLSIINESENFSVQLWIQDVKSNNLGEVKKQKLEEAKAEKFFSKVIREEDAGFIYEKQIDSTTADYDFRFIKLQGDKEYTFQKGLSGIFSLEAVEDMYEAVQGEKK